MKSTLIVGMGNPGEKYRNTRHNLGARVVETLSKQNPEVKTLLPQPGVFMNDFGKIVPKDREIMLIHDDIELPLGEIRYVAGGSAKGHKGVRSVQTALGTQEIPRLRLGIGRPPTEEKEVSDYVLQNFTDEEEKTVQGVTREIVEWLSSLLLR